MGDLAVFINRKTFFDFGDIFIPGLNIGLLIGVMYVTIRNGFYFLIFTRIKNLKIAKNGKSKLH